MPAPSDRVLNSPPARRAVEPPPGSTADRGFDVEPAVLTAAAGNLDAEAELLSDTVKDLQARLAQLGSCWGDDIVGQRFAGRYEPAARTVVANITALSGGLGRIALALRAVAESYERADHITATPSLDTGVV